MIKNLLEKLSLSIADNEPIVVGCSAGPDSMALLHYLYHNTKNNIICCHINHNVRTESKEEEKYLANFCKQNNIIFETMKINKYTEHNFENEARNKRYTFYDQILTKYNSKYLFLAHHGDDLIETVLMKISRGSNLEGYAGIKEISKKNHYYIIRPLLEYTKDDLIEYNQKYNLKYYVDKSNEDTTYTRNWFRKNILPLLKQENINIHNSFLKYSKTLLEYNTYIEKTCLSIYPKIINNNTINLIEFNKLDPFIQKNLLYKFLTNYYQNKNNIITEKHIENILSTINNTKPNIITNLPHNHLARKSYDYLSIEPNQNNEPKNYKTTLKDINIIDNIIIKKIDTTKENGNDICKLNSKTINLPLSIRNRRPGDYIEQKGLNGKKKVKEIFIENKVPKNIRDKYPLLVDANDQIIWIPNLKKSKFDSQNNDFCDIILKYCEKEENDEQ